MAEHIIIIGAGACGLMAARGLCEKGVKVTVLEARNRMGGRICTIKGDVFSLPVEAGAEFIHGDLPLTQSLLNEAGIGYERKEGRRYSMENGELEESEEFIEDFDLLTSRLEELEEDMPFKEFLEKYFSGERYATLRESATHFAEGYDTARVEDVSSIALREEWTGGGTDVPYYVKEGYQGLVDFLAGECRKNGCAIHLSAIVKQIRWEKGRVEVITVSGERYTASKVIVTIPLGVLASGDGKAHIEIFPAVPGLEASLEKLGYGAVIKFLLEFRNTFWENEAFSGKAKQVADPGFLITEEIIPVWWSQLPRKTSMLTGWVGGPKADALSGYSDDELLEKALSSLANIFNTGAAFMREQLSAWKIVNWKADPFALGAYAYATVGSAEAIRNIIQPVEDTLYFAGEAFEHDNMGTVEAALASGKRVSGLILGSL